MNKKELICNVSTYVVLYIITITVFLSVVLTDPVKGDYPLLYNTIVVFFLAYLMKYGRSLVFMALAPWYDVWKKRDNSLWPQKTPLVSVLVPAFNEEVGLLSTVKSILRSTYKNTEIIVVNDGSTDCSHKKMLDFIASRKKSKSKEKSKINLLYFYQENGGKGKALNFALKKAKGNIIVSIDADCLVDEEAIEKFVRRFDNPKVAAVVGNVKIGNSENPVAVLQKLEFQFSFYWKKAESLLGIIYIVGGAAGAYRSKVLKSFHGYDESSITEDIDLSVKIQKEGMKIVYADDAIVYTEGASTLPGLVKQRTRWKFGWFQTFRRHPSMLFSSAKRHNRLLSWFIIPFTYVSNFILFFEPVFIFLLYIYSILTKDFTIFLVWLLIEMLPFFVHAQFDNKGYRKIFFVLLSPISWLLFYIITYVEHRALLSSLHSLITKKSMKWGTWKRVGIKEA